MTAPRPRRRNTAIPERLAKVETRLDHEFAPAITGLTGALKELAGHLVMQTDAMNRLVLALESRVVPLERAELTRDIEKKVRGRIWSFIVSGKGAVIGIASAVSVLTTWIAKHL